MKTPQDYLEIITKAHPCPAESGFERAAWLCETRNALRSLLPLIETEYKRQTADIRERGITSKTYALQEIWRPFAKVNIARLREQAPDIFENLVHLRPADAAKILGRKTLYRQAADLLGEDIRPFEQITVGDLEKTLTPAVAAAFIEKEKRLIDCEVIEQ